MSIADKITSIEGHLTADYEGLENLGADLTNVNKNIQNIRTCLDTIYDNLPKTTGEGSNLSLTTLKGRINVDDIKGDTEQDTTLGYNIAPVNTSSYTLGENYISITGGGNGATLFDNITLNANTTYYLKLVVLQKPTTSSTFSTYIDGTPNDNISFINFQNDSVGVVLTKTYTPTSNAILKVRQWGNSNNEFIKFQYWITTDNTKNTYEPYTNGASPNPTYPQDINVVTGTQEVVVQNKNLFNKDTITENQRIDPSGNKNYDENCDLSDYIKIQPNTTYTRNITASVYECIAFYTSEKVFISRDTTHSTTTSPSNAYYVRISCYKTNLDTLQFELGSTASSYVEHQEQTKTLHLGDIELSKIGTYQDRIFRTSGKNLFDKDTMKEGYLIQVNGEEVANASYGASDYIPIKANTYYTRTNCNNYYGAFYNTNKEFVGAITNANTIISSVDGYVRISFLLTNVEKVMLNLGSSALPYEPYGSDKWYIEKNNIEKDKDYLVAQVGQVDTITDYARIRVYLNNACISTPTGLCSHFKFEASYSGQSNHFYAQGNYAYLIVDKTLLSTIDVTGAKAYLNTLTGLKILYPLATPTYTEITNETLLNELNELEKMMSYNGQTNISISGNLPMILDVTALKGE